MKKLFSMVVFLFFVVFSSYLHADEGENFEEEKNAKDASSLKEQSDKIKEENSKEKENGEKEKNTHKEEESESNKPVKSDKPNNSNEEDESHSVEEESAEEDTKNEKKHSRKKDLWTMSSNSLGSVGLGLGMQYGFFGINVEVAPIQFKYWELINIVANFGITPDEILAYSGGLRIYILGSDSVWRPRLTLTYGVNAQLVIDQVIITDSGPLKYKYNESHHGLIAAAGIRFLFGEEKRHGLDFDLNIIPFSTVYKRVDELKEDGITENKDKPFPLNISFGYRFAF